MSAPLRLKNSISVQSRNKSILADIGSPFIDPTVWNHQFEEFFAYTAGEFTLTAVGTPTRALVSNSTILSLGTGTTANNTNVGKRTLSPIQLPAVEKTPARVAGGCRFRLTTAVADARLVLGLIGGAVAVADYAANYNLLPGITIYTTAGGNFVARTQGLAEGDATGADEQQLPFGPVINAWYKYSFRADVEYDGANYLITTKHLLYRETQADNAVVLQSITNGSAVELVNDQFGWSLETLAASAATLQLDNFWLANNYRT